MKPVFIQELVPDTRSQRSIFVSLQNAQGPVETSRKVRASVTILSLALSLGASGTLFSRAEAAESLTLPTAPSGDMSGALSSYGASDSHGASATYHTVADGETVWDIAQHHGVEVAVIKAANGMASDQVIQAGQVLKVPPARMEAESLLVSWQGDEPQNMAVAEQPQAVEDLQPLPVTASKVASSNLSAFLNEQRLDKEAFVEDEDSESVSPDEGLPDASSPLPDASSPLPDASALSPVDDVPQRFSEPQALPSGESGVQALGIIETPGTPPQVTPAPEALHQVKSGETIWSIAHAHDVAPDTLQQANRVSDPNLIYPGDSLVIPNITLPDQDNPGISYSQQPNEQLYPWSELELEQSRAEADEPLSSVMSPADESSPEAVAIDEALLPDITVPDDTDSSADSDVGSVDRPDASDPYVAGLLSDVALATQERQEWTETNVSSEVSVGLVLENIDKDDETSSLEGGVHDPSKVGAVNPQFSPSSAESSSLEGGDAGIFSSEELLAAAPLGSEVYAPVVEGFEGRVVSPSMPVLPVQEDHLPEAPARFRGYIWPAQGVLTSGYGWRWGRMHRGVDIAGPVGTPIFAAAPGVVVRSGWNSGGYGNLVDIRHPDGSMTRYAHNSRLIVQAGQQVRQGQQIAEMGSTGYSTGPHLHFEIHTPDQGTVNPMAHLPGQ